jgi:hypothetical protein
MIKLTDLKPGDIVRVLDEGVEREGIVQDISRDENMVCVNNGIQEFWYMLDEIVPVPLTEQQLLNLGFERQETDNGSVKYLRGPFRILSHDPGNNTHLEIWYREDHRHFNHPLYVHELQNHYLQMTKVHLEKPQIH